MKFQIQRHICAQCCTPIILSGYNSTFETLIEILKTRVQTFWIWIWAGNGLLSTLLHPLKGATIEFLGDMLGIPLPYGRHPPEKPMGKILTHVHFWFLA